MGVPPARTTRAVTPPNNPNATYNQKIYPGHPMGTPSVEFLILQWEYRSGRKLSRDQRDEILGVRRHPPHYDERICVIDLQPPGAQTIETTSPTPAAMRTIIKAEHRDSNGALNDARERIRIRVEKNISPVIKPWAYKSQIGALNMIIKTNPVPIREKAGEMRKVCRAAKKSLLDEKVKAKYADGDTLLFHELVQAFCERLRKIKKAFAKEDVVGEEENALVAEMFQDLRTIRTRERRSRGKRQKFLRRHVGKSCDNPIVIKD